MDPIIGGAIVSGAGQLGGAALGGKAAKEAAKIQAKSAAEALAFTREQEQAAQGRYGQSKAQYDQQVADWYAARNALLGRYGVDISLGAGGLQGSGPAPSMPGVSSSTMPGTTPSASSSRPPTGLPTTATNRPPTGATIGDLAQPNTSWNDWNRYGI